jgi:hypothetical protein
MIIIDATQICIAAIAYTLTKSKIEITDELIRHIVLNSIRSKVKMFKKEYGPEVVLAFDGHTPWRKSIFPEYKFKRAKQKQDSVLNWEKIFEYLNMVCEELKENLPYITIKIDHVEADDVIAVVARGMQARFPDVRNVIISSDKDFNQLITKTTKQFSPKLKAFIDCKDPKYTLKQLIIEGDDSDGIPNVLSQGNCFVIGKRQTPLTAKRIAELMNQTVDRYAEDVKANYKRNEALISFDYIPNDIRKQIQEACKVADKTKANRQKMLQYLSEKKLRELIDVADEF